jgi:hypothetical protein
MARSLHPTLRIFDNTNPEKEIASFTAMPNFFIDSLMLVGKGIPSSFWKFTFVLMRGILSDQEKDTAGKLYHTYEWKSTSGYFKERYDLGDLAVQDWTNAYSVSGLFTIKKGRKHLKADKGTPTEWRYNTHATLADWVCFVIALSKVLNGDTRMARHGTYTGEDGEEFNCANSFKLALAMRVDHVRGENKPESLPCVNDKRIEVFLERGYGWRDGDGLINWNYRKPHTPESDADMRERRHGT